MAQAIVTQSMQARADDLLSHADRWSRGTRNEDGQPFFLFSGSKGATYMASERGCSCPSYLHRGACSHHVAVCRFEHEIEQAFADVARCRSCGERTLSSAETICRVCRRRLLGCDDD